MRHDFTIPGGAIEIKQKILSYSIKQKEEKIMTDKLLEYVGKIAAASEKLFKSEIRCTTNQTNTELSGSFCGLDNTDGTGGVTLTVNGKSKYIAAGTDQMFYFGPFTKFSTVKDSDWDSVNVNKDYGVYSCDSQ